MKNLELLILIGPPGSGKGTLAANLAATHHYHPVSTGELLRRAAQADPTLAAQLADGSLTPDATIERLLTRAVRGHPKVLLDGYPRTHVQIGRLQALFPNARIRALNLDVPDELSLTRIALRAAQTPEHQRRPEDDPAVARSRLNVFHQQTRHVIHAYALWNVLNTIDGRGTPHDVLALARHALQHAPAGYRQRSPYRWKRQNKLHTELKRTERRMMQAPHHFRNRPERVRMSQQQQAIFIRQGILKVCRHGQPLSAGELVRRRHGLFGGRFRTATVVRITPDGYAAVDWGDQVQMAYLTTELKRA